MSVKKEIFGVHPQGEVVYKFEITNKLGTKITVSNFGAILISLLFKDKKGKLRDLVLGYDTLLDYLDNHPMFGATVGRNINRISNANFELDGKKYYLKKNRGEHNIHSDKDFGFHKVIWDYKIIENNSVCFSYLSPENDQGFPGEVYMKVTYTLTDTNALILSYYGTPTKKTILNVANHSYFNLDGHDSDIFDTEFRIKSKFFTPIDEDIIPTGEIVSVKDTPMDFTSFSNLTDRLNSNYEQLQIECGYDHNFVIDNPKTGLRLVAQAKAKQSGIHMDVYSDMPGLQFYTSNSLKETKGKNNVVYRQYSAFCMEPDYFPNAINVEGFEKPIFDSNREFLSTTIYQFYKEV